MAERFLRIFPTQMSEVEDIDSSKVLASDSNDQPVYVKGSSFAKKSEVESVKADVNNLKNFAEHYNEASEEEIPQQSLLSDSEENGLKTIPVDHFASSADLEAEETARSEADSALTSAINTEKAARESADTALDGKISAEATTRGNADTALGNRITAVEGVIPENATTANLLATKKYVDDGIEQMSAKYLSYSADGQPFPSKAAFDAGVFYYGGQVVQPTKNDYALVNGDESHDGAVTRYIYTTSWAFQYVVNNSPLNAAQLAALNSGATAEKIADIANKANKSYVDEELGKKADQDDLDAEIASVRPIAKGGTGATTANEAEYNVTAGMGEGLANITDDTPVVCVQSNPSAATGRFIWKKIAYIFDYIKTKLNIKNYFSATDESPISGLGVADAIKDKADRSEVPVLDPSYTAGDYTKAATCASIAQAIAAATLNPSQFVVDQTFNPSSKNAQSGVATSTTIKTTWNTIDYSRPIWGTMYDVTIDLGKLVNRICYTIFITGLNKKITFTNSGTSNKVLAIRHPYSQSVDLKTDETFELQTRLGDVIRFYNVDSYAFTFIESDATSTYEPTGFRSINGTAVASALAGGTAVAKNVGRTTLTSSNNLDSLDSPIGLSIYSWKSSSYAINCPRTDKDSIMENLKYSDNFIVQKIFLDGVVDKYWLRSKSGSSWSSWRIVNV